MKATHVVVALVFVGVLGAGSSARAAIALVNGSFETTGALYNGALGGLYEASGWTNASGLNIQASSMLAGQEGTNASGATGARILRLVDDVNVPANRGIIYQNVGTMTAGETYTFTADALGGSSAATTWGATASFTLDAAGTMVLATQTVDGLIAGQNVATAFNFSYVATLANAGQALYIRLVAKDVGAGQATRGGIDNATLLVAVPSPAALPAGLALIGAIALRRRPTR